MKYFRSKLIVLIFFSVLSLTLLYPDSIFARRKRLIPNEISRNTDITNASVVTSEIQTQLIQLLNLSSRKDVDNIADFILQRAEHIKYSINLIIDIIEEIHSGELKEEFNIVVLVDVLCEVRQRLKLPFNIFSFYSDRLVRIVEKENLYIASHFAKALGSAGGEQTVMILRDRWEEQEFDLDLIQLESLIDALGAIGNLQAKELLRDILLFYRSQINRTKIGLTALGVTSILGKIQNAVAEAFKEISLIESREDSLLIHMDDHDDAASLNGPPPSLSDDIVQLEIAAVSYKEGQVIAPLIKAEAANYAIWVKPGKPLSWDASYLPPYTSIPSDYAFETVDISHVDDPLDPEVTIYPTLRTVESDKLVNPDLFNSIFLATVSIGKELEDGYLSFIPELREATIRNETAREIFQEFLAKKDTECEESGWPKIVPRTIKIGSEVVEAGRDKYLEIKLPNEKVIYVGEFHNLALLFTALAKKDGFLKDNSWIGDFDLDVTDSELSHKEELIGHILDIARRCDVNMIILGSTFILPEYRHEAGEYAERIINSLITIYELEELFKFSPKTWARKINEYLDDNLTDHAIRFVIGKMVTEKKLALKLLLGVEELYPEIERDEVETLYGLVNSIDVD